MKLSRTKIDGVWMPWVNVALVTDDYGNEIRIKLLDKSVCPIYHFLNQTYR